MIHSYKGVQSCALLRVLYGGVRMSITSWAAGQRFVFRTIKYLQTNPANKWANSYEFVAQAAGSDSELLSLSSALVLFEANIHRNVVLFDRVLISTWEADSKPYDPEVFISIPQSGSGLIGPVGDNLALDKCLAIARVPQTGRFGHLFYRGVLNEADTAAPAGKSILTDRAGIQSQIDAALGTSELEAYLGLSRPANLTMSMINKTGTQVRNVVTLTVQGVTSLPTDHAWFNRREEPTP